MLLRTGTDEDRLEIATLRAGRVRAAMLCFCMGERAEGTEGQWAGTGVSDLAELQAFLTLGLLGGGKHLFDFPVLRGEIAGWEEGESLGRCYGNNYGGGSHLFTGFRVRVKVKR